MVKVREDLTGKIFGRLKVIKQVEDYVTPKGMHYANWLCECNCLKHNIVEVTGNALKRGSTLSCGCIRDEKLIERRKKYNQYSEKLYDEYGEYYIGYTNNTGSKFYIDAEDFDKIKNYCWNEHVCNNMSYIWAHINKKHITMHVFLGFKWYDHIDRNELNNRRYNLRECTIQENRRNHSILSNNTSGFTGVCLIKRNNTWKSYITIDNNNDVVLGYFKNIDNAIKARLQAEREYFGEFAPQQHLFEKYGIEPITAQSD